MTRRRSNNRIFLEKTGIKALDAVRFVSMDQLRGVKKRPGVLYINGVEGLFFMADDEPGVVFTTVGSTRYFYPLSHSYVDRLAFGAMSLGLITAKDYRAFHSKYQAADIRRRHKERVADLRRRAKELGFKLAKG